MTNLNLSVYYRLILVLAVLSCVFSFHSCKKEKETPFATVSVSGKVVDAFGKPLADVKITLDGQIKQSALTNSSGEFVFKIVTAGDYRVLASKDKYISESQEVTVSQENVSSIDFHLLVGEATLEISTEDFLYSFKTSGNTVDVSSNSAWLVETSADWLTSEVGSGQGNQTLSIYAKENTSDEERTATITISAGAVKKTIHVIQDFKLRLVSISLTHPISDSVVLHFNKRVEEVWIDPLDQSCQTRICCSSRPESSEVRFKYSCARMGGSYSFLLQLKDKLEAYRENITVDFFSKRLAFEREGYSGSPNCYVFEDSRTLWVCGLDQNLIQEVDLESFQVVRTYTLPIRVGRLCYNPYNKLIYITGESADFYMLDPVAHKVIGKKTIVPIRGDHAVYPEIYPTMMGFTKSGLGVMTCKGSDAQAGTWKMIDSRKDNQVYYYKDRETIEDIGKIDVNAEQNRLLLKMNYANELYSFDPAKEDINVILPPVSGVVSQVKPNKKNGNLIFLQANHQYLYNPGTKYLSQLSYLRHGCKGDFSYRSNEEELVYAFDANNYLQVLDYKSGSAVLQFPILNQLSTGEMLSTTDGKYLIASGGTTLYRFDTELLSPKKGRSAISNMKNRQAFMR